jgi:hypothetical protein
MAGSFVAGIRLHFQINLDVVKNIRALAEALPGCQDGYEPDD